ncbi:MAG TPA: hypothetical protein VGP94_02225 [Tepidisphaeraceae bacterium]|jgi:hypothetical protein|nr:hypothetical protein [Tepidisphaeraceae bacterium]
MVRALFALAVLSMVSSAMGQMVVGDDEKVVQMKHNPSYDNLYRPGNPIWRLRMLRMGLVPSINDTNADLNTTIDMGSVESSPMVAEPLRINGTNDMLSMPSDQQRDMEALIKDEAAKPAAKANDEGFEARRHEPNRNIEVTQINPKGPNVQLAARGQIIIKPYDRSQPTASPIVSR